MRTQSVLRGGLYVVTATVVVAAAASALGEQRPGLWLVAGLVAAHALVLAIPVVCDPASGRRCSLQVGTVIVIGVALSPGWGVLACAAGAVLSGLHIRRHRTTPGGMAFGASSVTLGAAAAIVAIDQAVGARDSVPVLGAAAVVGWLSYHASEAVIVAAVRTRRPGRGGARRRRWFAPVETSVPVIGIGALGGYLALHDPAALLLAVVPLATLVRYGSTRGRAVGQLQRLSAVLDLAHDAEVTADLDALERGLVDHAAGVLGAPVRLGGPPGDDEIGAPLPAPDAADRWLVAERRTGAPTWQGRYRPEDRQALERIAAIGSSAARKLRLLAEVQHLAMHDTLTGLPNRALFDEHLSGRLARAQRSGAPFAVAFIDLDHFKSVNDRHGHPVGDAVLQLVADRLRDLCREGDTVARWGGEEFVVLADLDQSSSAAAAGQLARRLVEGLRCCFEVAEGLVVTTTASVGIAVYPDHASTQADLLRVADTAALEAKGLGRNCAVLSGHRPPSDRTLASMTA